MPKRLSAVIQESGAALVASIGLSLIALFAVGAWPYRLALLPLVGACIAICGAMAGSFFPWAQRGFPAARPLFFHENNGFLAGLAAALLASVYLGQALLDYAPLSLVPVVLLSGRGLVASGD